MLHTTKTDVIHPGTTVGLPYEVRGNFTPAAKKAGTDVPAFFIGILN